MSRAILHELGNASASDRQFAERARATLDVVLADRRFLEMVRGGRYSSSWYRADSGGYDEATPDEVAERIVRGHEVGTADDETVDLRVIIEPLDAGVMGVVYPPAPVIHTNTTFFQQCVEEDDPLSLAAHWMHEWMHVAGFYHPRWRKTQDVAYRVGDFVAAVGSSAQSVGLLPSARHDLGYVYLKASHDGACPVVISEAASTERSRRTLKSATQALETARVSNLVTGRPSIAIDAHAHTFNASDLSVEGFLRDVVIDADEQVPRRILKPLIKLLSSVAGTAPGVEEELRRLDERQRASANRLTGVFEQKARGERAERDRAFHADVERAIAQLAISTDSGDRALYEEFKHETGTAFLSPSAEVALLPSIVGGILGSDGILSRYVRWIGRLRHYRHEIIEELLDTYGEGEGSVTLFLSAMVDFARWVHQEPASSPEEQVRVGSRLSRAFPGRIHFLAAFDPWREIAHSGPSKSPFEVVRDAVEKYGFVGVKLYPPMGFAATGNADLDFSLSGVQNSRDHGVRLDEALEKLYAWAVEKQVPIMAHCNASQGSKEDYQLRASPEYWRQVLKRHKTLRLNLGHFGGQANLGVAAGWPELIIGLMSCKDYPHVYADVGMFDMGDDEVRTRWFALLRETMSHEPALAQHLMYGSDWLMLAKERRASEYFALFAADICGQCTPEVARDILGGNAARFLGLERGGQTNARLKHFYEASELPAPAWLE